MGDDHQIGGHHFRAATGYGHLHYNEGGEDIVDPDEDVSDGDDYPFADDPDDEPKEVEKKSKGSSYPFADDPDDDPPQTKSDQKQTKQSS